MFGVDQCLLAILVVLQTVLSSNLPLLIGHQQLCPQMERALAPVDTLLIV